NSSCETAECPQLTQACCSYLDSICEDLRPFECRRREGDWTPQGRGTMCQEGFCDQRIPLACCYPDGTCENELYFSCLQDPEGEPGTAGSTCGTTECPRFTRACCMPDGSCSDLLPPECREAGGRVGPRKSA